MPWRRWAGGGGGFRTAWQAVRRSWCVKPRVCATLAFFSPVTDRTGQSVLLLFPLSGCVLALCLLSVSFCCCCCDLSVVVRMIRVSLFRFGGSLSFLLVSLLLSLSLFLGGWCSVSSKSCLACFGVFIFC